MNAFSLHHHFSTIETNGSFSSLTPLERQRKERKVNKKCKQFQFSRHNIFVQTSIGRNQSHHNFYTNNNNNSYNKKKKYRFRVSAKRLQQLLHCHSSSLPTVIRAVSPLLSPVTAITERSERRQYCSERTTKKTTFIISFARFSSLFEWFVCNQIRSWSCQREFLQQQARVTSHQQCPFSSG